MLGVLNRLLTAPPVPTQQGEGYFARTLCITDLTVHHLASSHYCVVTIINLPISPFNYSLVSYSLQCTRLCPIVMLFLSPLPPFPFLSKLRYVFS